MFEESLLLINHIVTLPVLHSLEPRILQSSINGVTTSIREEANERLKYCMCSFSDTLLSTLCHQQLILDFLDPLSCKGCVKTKLNKTAILNINTCTSLNWPGTSHSSCTWWLMSIKIDSSEHELDSLALFKTMSLIMKIHEACPWDSWSNDCVTY